VIFLPAGVCLGGDGKEGQIQFPAHLFLKGCQVFQPNQVAIGGTGANCAFEPLAPYLPPHGGELFPVFQQVLGVDCQPVTQRGGLGRLQVGECHHGQVGVQVNLVCQHCQQGLQADND